MKYLFFYCFLFISSNAYATSIISGTRLIFDGAKKESTINVSNTGSMPSLIQSWVDDGDARVEPSKIDVPFFIPNALVTLDPESSFSLRVFTTDAIKNYPTDKESLFYLNVVDIPPKSETTVESSGGMIQFVVRSRIKLIYRPAGLSGNANLSLGNLTFSNSGNELSINNPTPYFINVNKVIDKNTKKILVDAMIIPPFSERNKVVLAKNSNSIIIQSLNDLGATVERDINL